MLAAASIVASLVYLNRAARAEQQAAAARAEADTLRARVSASAAVVAPAPEDSPAEVPAIAVARADDSEAQARIRELETALAEKDRVIWDLQARATNRPPPEDRRGRDRGDWMEDLRQRDPARYEEMQKRREERQREVSRQYAEKAAYFLKRDTSKMTDEEKASYDLMLQLLDETWRLSEQMRSELSPEQRRELGQALREKARVLNPLLEEERARTFIELGEQVGYAGAAATEFADYLESVIDLTSPRGMFRGGPPGGRGPGGSGGAPPGP
ncbi:MAG TPA: hypothetical protein P5567_10730 [Kiritimatiellia bacterium]|nr:hypothetical protein [Kiritimatiellia bacterium]HRZ12915.1 hypothetical protein [Kiritimatiellia bacterium]HSA18475.1 hypothetical protein [Kiritimatiellia bacterium]